MWHEIVNRIIQHQQHEIALYCRIAESAPNPALRKAVLQMVEHEKRELEWWKNLLHGEMPGGCHPPGGYYPPGSGYHGGGYAPDPGYAPYGEKKEQKK